MSRLMAFKVHLKSKTHIVCGCDGAGHVRYPKRQTDNATHGRTLFVYKSIYVYYMSAFVLLVGSACDLVVFAPPSMVWTKGLNFAYAFCSTRPKIVHKNMMSKLFCSIHPLFIGKQNGDSYGKADAAPTETLNIYVNTPTLSIGISVLDYDLCDMNVGARVIN